MPAVFAGCVLAHEAPLGLAETQQTRHGHRIARSIWRCFRYTLCNGFTLLRWDEASVDQQLRAIGLLCAVELKPREGAPGARATEVAQRCFDAGVLVRASGENIVLSPPLIISEEQIDRVFGTLAKAIEATR